jgi:hypothetical protein
MAERDQIGGPLRPHDPRQPRDAQDVALLGVAGLHQRKRLGRIFTCPSATASRAVVSLSETSTICAWPARVEMGELAAHAGPGRVGEQRRVACVAPRPPAASGFADQETARAASGHLGQIGGREQPAIRRSPSGPGTRGASVFVVSSVVSKVFRSRLLMPISGLFSLSVAVQLRPVMHLDQRVHPPMPRRVLQLARLPVARRGHDDQDAIRAPGARLGHLVGS